MVCLYIATHNITGKKYFGKTTKWFTLEDLQKNYYGSGKYWKKHIEKYGKDVTMKIYGIFSLNPKDKNYVEPIALAFSKNNNIINDKKWANLIFENGLDGGGGSKKGLKRKKNKQCLYCNKKLYPSEEMYHFEYCFYNPNRLLRKTNCVFCNKTFKDNTGCKNHEIICKNNPNKEIFACKYCNKKYFDRRNRNRHELTCENNKHKIEYFCKFCNKQYKNNSSLIKHQNICEMNDNKKELVYNCIFCNKEFKNSKVNLIKHEKHYCSYNPNIEKLEFKCNCNKIYSDKGNFVKHTLKCNFI